MSRKLFLTCILSVIWFIGIYFSIKSELSNDLKTDNKKHKFIFTGYYLPLTMVISMMLHPFFYGTDTIVTEYLNFLLNLIIVFTFYYLFIFIFLKLLRKFLHPLVVSTLWMLPNILYIFIMYRYSFFIDNVIIIEISSKVLFLAFLIWILGFLIIISFKCIEHLNYRKILLEDARDITDENILKLFEIEKEKIDNQKITLKLVKSNQLQTPLTIGVRNKILVLPNKNYSNEELQLIFNHEIIHVARDDVMTKIYLVFCNACCWFNPIMWLSNKKCSEDLELSCDVSVLSNANEYTRKQYAILILKTANSE